MFELAITDHWWELAKRYPVLSNHPNILKPLGYAHILNLIETYKPKTVLEVGHGSGTYLFQLFKENKNIELWGLDSEVKDSSVSVEDLKNVREWNPHVKFVDGLLGTNVKELPDNYFDLVYSVSVIEHIPHEYLPSVFEETFRILKPGGIVSHSYDVYYNQDTSAVFNAYSKSGLKWLKPRNTMNVFWEPWLDKMDFDSLVDLCEKIVMENPIFVAEQYMWQQERNSRLAPMNYLTVLTAAMKPCAESKNIKDNSEDVLLKFRENNIADILLPENFNLFTYSKNYHFDLFKELGYDKELFKNGIDSLYCDIKSYQDLLVYSFIKNNIPVESKILEIGGNGFNRVLDKLKNDYEVWNIDKPDEIGISKIDTSKIKFVNDSIGNNNTELKENYFDLVFSTSFFKYDDFNDTIKYDKILKDLDRIQKSGGYSLHCVIAMLKDPIIMLPQLIKFLFENDRTTNEFILPLKISIDPELYSMSEKYYEDNWQSFTGKTFNKFGKPISYNVISKKV